MLHAEFHVYLNQQKIKHMKTKMFLSTLLTLAIHVIAMSQTQTTRKQILLSCASRSQTLLSAEKPVQKQDVVELNQRIRSYDDQIAELQKAKQALNSDISIFFDSLEANTQTAELASLETLANHSLQLYEKNYASINALLASASSKVTPALFDLLVRCGTWANSARLIKKEAYAEANAGARAGAIANCLEKLNAALDGQASILSMLDKPASTTGAICYGPNK